MDTGETGEGADELHLRDTKIVVEKELISPKGMILIDDVNIAESSQSKGRYPQLHQELSAGNYTRQSGSKLVLRLGLAERKGGAQSEVSGCRGAGG